MGDAFCERDTYGSYYENENSKIQAADRKISVYW